MGQVEGKVSIDGTPVSETGYTLYLDPKGARGTVIEVGADGTYSGPAVIGENTVTIAAPSSAHGESSTSAGNTSSEGSPFARLTIEVKESGTTTQDLDFKKN
jgi:hypothetical protein